MQKPLVALALVAALASLGGPAFAQGKDKPAPTATKQAKELSEAVIAVAEKVSPSVVQIDVAVRDDMAEVPWWLKKKESSLIHGNGSGVILTADGYVLTNNHVIEDALTITVKTRDGKFLPAKIKGRDPATDIAVIKVEATGLPAAKMGDSDAAKVGEWVVAVGSPFGLSYTVTSGVVSAKGRGGLGMNVVEDYIQTDASINPGNSGGPLVNLNGEVLGINTLIVGKGSGIGFAVPSNMAKKVSEQLIKNGKVVRAWLGVTPQTLTPELAKAFGVLPYAGVLIADTAPTGPAAAAKIVPGDIVAKVGGKPVREAQDLIREVINHDVGSAVTVEVIRSGKIYETKATLAPRPEPPVKPTPSEEIIKANPSVGYGITMKPLPPDMAQKWGLLGKSQVYISAVEPGSPADKAGLVVSDAIMEAGGVANPTVDQVKKAGEKGTLLMRIDHKGEKAYLSVTK